MWMYGTGPHYSCSWPRPVLSLPHEGVCVQDFHPLILKCVELHHDRNTDGSDELFSSVSTPIKTSWLGHLSVLQCCLVYCTTQPGAERGFRCWLQLVCCA